ncbi:MAG: hypothetical protein NC092_01270 [Butyrivibrio sp.]|nr:hypothetical protein [Muribaculum sp.]MCM1551303.1 hypothetical protein [Butyrivibrio sp.]
MNRRKKLIIGFIAVLSLCFVMYAALYACVLWHGIFAYIIPWTSTQFANYQSYSTLLKNYKCKDYFLDELPMGAAEPKYYWHHESWEAFAAYSTTLPEESFKTLLDERMDFFREMEEEFSLENIIFSFQEEGYCYIDDPKWCADEIVSEEDLAFINEVVEEPEAKDKYYYFAVIRSDYHDTMCYNGVILNDDTHEFIEFSVEVVNHDKWRF